MADPTTPQPANESGHDVPAPAIGHDEAGFATAAYQLHRLDEQVADIKTTRPADEGADLTAIGALDRAGPFPLGRVEVAATYATYRWEPAPDAAALAALLAAITTGTDPVSGHTGSVRPARNTRGGRFG
jgi:hypothetical protein